MIDKSIFLASLKSYKETFDKRWPYEKYKWEAIKCFQDNWDITADDFGGMFLKATAKTENLLASVNNFPRGMINEYAQFDQEAVRSMFINLFDESQLVTDRVIAFVEASKELCEKYTPTKQHYQRPMAITVYLWLMNPSKYEVFKYSVAKATSRYLKCEFVPKKGEIVKNIEGNAVLIDEIVEYIREDSELQKMYLAKIDDDCYKEESLRTAASDISFYIANYLADANAEGGDWLAEDYSPCISKQKWGELLCDSQIFTASSLEIMARFVDCGGQASCKQLSDKYGENYNFYNNGATSLAKRVADATNCPVRTGDNGEIRYWSVLFMGRKASKEESGVFVWKIRDELFQALQEFNMSGTALYKNLYEETTSDYELYSKEDFLNEVYMSAESYDILKNLLLKKQNVILQGAPGVGKTFAAKRLVYSIMGKKDDSSVEFIQFHQNYSYEDFIMGYKPNGDGFELKNGIFYNFCQKAIDNPKKQYFFIIDEINRGNMSKIFGELLMLIEKDYRGTKATLAYNGKSFYVPRNLYIVGMMNTADRSLAMIDYALRRRFSFFAMEPGFGSDGFKEYMNSLGDDTFNALIESIMLLNKAIADDPSLGNGFCIGHSYFCGQEKSSEEDMFAWMSSVIDFDIVPMLEEYWFDEPDKVKMWKNRLRGVFNN